MTLPIWNRIIQKLSWFCVMFYELYIYFILNKLQYKLEYKLRLWLLSHSYLNIMWTSWSFLSKGTSKPSKLLLINSAINLFPSGHLLSNRSLRLPIVCHISMSKAEKLPQITWHSSGLQWVLLFLLLSRSFYLSLSALFHLLFPHSCFAPGQTTDHVVTIYIAHQRRESADKCWKLTLCVCVCARHM